MLRKSILFALLAVLALAVPAVHAQSCPGGQFYLDLKSCTTATMAGVSFMPGGACAAAVVPTGCPASAGWKQAALKVVVPAGCTQINVTVQYEGLPCGWTVDLGDSPTDNGYGGDSGSTPHNAELQILNENLAVYNGSGNAALVDNLAGANLALTNAALNFVVKDQFVSWGNPYTYLSTPNNKMLYSFSDPAGPRTVYLGLNRVIQATGGRTGYGARRVLVTFQ
jgi:hypothetical protein